MRASLRSVAAIALAAVVVAGVPGCSSTATEDGPTAADRIATIRELRGALGPPAAEVGTAAATLGEVLDELHASPPTSPEARRRAVGTVRDRDLRRLVEATPGLRAAATALPGDGEGGASGADDASAAATAVAEVLAGVDALAAAADVDLDLIAAAADAEDRLTALVSAWDEPGSRSQQLERLGETAAAADALAAELDTTADVPPCAGLVARRAEAARAVARHTRELRELVERRAGGAFDERRAELIVDPYGTGALLVELDAEDLACWRSSSPVVAALDATEAGLAALEVALNPTDLSEAPSGE